MTTRLMPLMLVVALLACASSCAKPDWIQDTLVTVDVTGTWVNTTGSLFKLQLEQQGPKVIGSAVMWGLTSIGTTVSANIEGSVTGDVFRFHQTSGAMRKVEGELTVSGESMRGWVYSESMRRLIELQHTESSPRPASQP